MQLGFFQMLRGVRETTKDAVFPPRCCGCGRLYRIQRPGKTLGQESGEINQRFLTILADHLCDTCARMIEPIQSPLCTHCGRPFDAPQGVDHLCGQCQQDPFDFAMARSAGIYSHVFKALICLFKYQYRSELAVPLSRLLWETLGLHWDPGELDCIIPVPLHRRRLRERGFNQAELLIRHWPELAQAQGVTLEKAKLTNRMLVRCRYTTPQTGLDRDQRIANLQRAFKLSAPEAVQGCRVLLVDDVLTTGATANACARALKSAKAASVKVLTLARAI